MKTKVSVLVPIKNEEVYIKSCLSQLLKQVCKYITEILVVDGMSSDRTREIVTREVEATRSSEENVIRLIDNSKGHRASALNIGIKEAKGDIIIRIDARTIIPPGYIEKCMKAMIETEADNVGGIQKPIITMSYHADNKSALTQMAIGTALSHPFGVGNAQFRLGNKSGFVDTVYLGCFRREIFEKVGLFDEESAVISEDADMNYRIRQAGGKVYFNKDIVAYYYPKDNFKDLWKLYFRYGGAKAGNLLKRGRLTAWRQLVPPVFLFSFVFFPIAGILLKPLLNLWLGILGIYLSINFSVCINLAYRKHPSEFKPPINVFISDGGIVHDELPWGLKQKLPLFWRLLLVFPIIHFSWALGFWKRLLQRPKRGEYWKY